ncbi:formate dehydrogenase subunit gamma [Haemophilus aegyptius]|uniref:Formate dehydrogenase subunit gamma n=1 Tax=Haemophilus aegyptius TaxID=197575 RepID=A0ABY1VW53_HAEAE|nr:formate dehydrogenase, cytochrome B556 subunit [Haemophilus aegyptius ATCC 11116]SQH38220.1 formate dehydrogenase subunit gamma [Haemophilus aegyptius]VEH54604.1 formate dehydrogenase subunit gamma [Haemophilus aegyptius]
MAFWVKGSIRGIVEGWVTVCWAKKHHPRWYREEVLSKLEEDLLNEQSGKVGKTKVLFKGFGK